MLFGVFAKKNPLMAKGGRVTGLKPTRQAKRKEADATGPQGGYGIRLACPGIRAKGMPNGFLASLFLYI
jgi:hypothetical protein